MVCYGARPACQQWHARPVRGCHPAPARHALPPLRAEVISKIGVELRPGHNRLATAVPRGKLFHEPLEALGFIGDFHGTEIRLLESMSGALSRFDQRRFFWPRSLVRRRRSQPRSAKDSIATDGTRIKHGAHSGGVRNGPLLYPHHLMPAGNAAGARVHFVPIRVPSVFHPWLKNRSSYSTLQPFCHLGNVNLRTDHLPPNIPLETQSQ